MLINSYILVMFYNISPRGIKINELFILVWLNNIDLRKLI